MRPLQRQLRYYIDGPELRGQFFWQVRRSFQPPRQETNSYRWPVVMPESTNCFDVCNSESRVNSQAVSHLRVLGVAVALVESISHRLFRHFETRYARRGGCEPPCHEFNLSSLTCTPRPSVEYRFQPSTLHFRNESSGFCSPEMLSLTECTKSDWMHIGAAASEFVFYVLSP